MCTFRNNNGKWPHRQKTLVPQSPKQILCTATKVCVLPTTPVLILCVLLSISASAAAEQTPPFGSRGQFVFGPDLTFDIRRTSYSESPTGRTADSSLSLTIAPALDYFVLKNLSIGGQVYFTYAKQGNLEGSAIGFGPRVGYALAFNDWVTLWPRAGVSFTHTQTDDTRSFSGLEEISREATSLQLSAPLLITPVSHFAIGVGPFATIDLLVTAEQQGSSHRVERSTTLGIATTLVGYFLFFERETSRGAEIAVATCLSLHERTPERGCISKIYLPSH